MARYIGGVNGTRGPVTRLGDGKNGVRSWVQGWNVGVRVQGNPSDKDGTDTFTIYATGGTNGACPDRLIGVVRESPNGPQIDRKSVV
jgi:hypothetical protein